MRTSIPLILICMHFLFLPGQAAAQSFSWAGSFGSTAEDMGYDVAADAAGNVFTVGLFQGSVDFNPGPGIFILRLPKAHSNLQVVLRNTLGQIVLEEEHRDADFLEMNTELRAGIYSVELRGDKGWSATLRLVVGE